LIGRAEVVAGCNVFRVSDPLAAGHEIYFSDTQALVPFLGEVIYSVSSFVKI
jgi:hypothetical protein